MSCFVANEKKNTFYDLRKKLLRTVNINVYSMAIFLCWNHDVYAKTFDHSFCEFFHCGLSVAHAQYVTFLWSSFSGVFEQEGGHVGRSVWENCAQYSIFFRKVTYAMLDLFFIYTLFENYNRLDGEQSLTVHGTQRKDYRSTLKRLRV